jgi:integrase
MSRGSEKLTSMEVKQQKEPGYWSDGGGLFLQVAPCVNSEKKPIPGEVTKSWIFVYTIHGKQRQMGLGSVNDCTLAEARTEAAKWRAVKREGKDPIEERRANNLASALAAAKNITFEAAAKQYIEAMRPGWKNAKHADQWLNTLTTYAFPIIGKLAVADVDNALVVQILEKDDLWTLKTETASRVRGRIESILDWSTVKGYRQGDNPARWKGNLQHLFPERSAVKKVKHHAAIEYALMPDFMKRLRAMPGVAPLALEFTILNACRTEEVIGADWGEFELKDRLWIIPAERTKTKSEHRAPLSDRSLEILQLVRTLPLSEHIFESKPAQNGKPGKPLSNGAMAAVLRRMGYPTGTATPHGTARSSFTDWAADETDYLPEVREMALGHAVGDKVEAAYRRGSLYKKRVGIMQDWSDYLAGKHNAGNVVPMNTKKTAA